MADHPDREGEAALDFQPDPWALQSILTSAGLAPGTLQPRFKAGPVSRSGLTPAAAGTLSQRFDGFQAPHGHVFFRPKTPRSRSQPAGPQGGPAGSRQRAWDRGVALSGRPKRVEPARAPAGPHTEGKNRPGWPPHRVPVYLSSISERKTLVPSSGIEWNGLKRESLARKALDFGGPRVQRGPGDKENQDPGPADRIRLRESVLAWPRPSLNGWLRASLTPAELDRMFEDDSTESFEAWEKRLKTPKRAPGPSTFGVDRTSPAQANLTQARPVPSPGVDSDRSAEPTGFLARLAAEMDPPVCATERLTPVSASKCSPLSSSPPSGGSKAAHGDSRPGLEVEVTREENELSTERNRPSSGPPSPVFEIVYEEPGPPPTVKSNKFERSMSLGDVSVVRAGDGDAISDPPDQPGSPLKTALSENDLTDARSTQDFLLEALQAHQDFMAEQDRIQDQINALMNQAQTRRSEFRGLWGVSPRSISQLRSVKTVLGHHKVQFSRPTDSSNPEPTSSSTAKATDPSDLVFSPQLEPLERVFGDLERDLDQGEDQTMSFEDMDITPCRGLMVRSKKSVQFAATTPIRHVITPSPSPRQVKVTVPLMIGRRSLDHEGQKSTSFLYTPMPKYDKAVRRSGRKGAGGDDDDSLKIPMNTPMALHSLSRKVQAELALLYEDEPNHDFVDARENLDFDA